MLLKQIFIFTFFKILLCIFIFPSFLLSFSLSFLSSLKLLSLASRCSHRRVFTKVVLDRLLGAIVFKETIKRLGTDTICSDWCWNLSTGIRGKIGTSGWQLPVNDLSFHLNIASRQFPHLTDVSPISSYLSTSICRRCQFVPRD